MTTLVSSLHIPHPPVAQSFSSSSFSGVYRRSNAFSNRILHHGGPARDTTIHAATQAAQREKKHFEKQFSQMDDIMAEFAAELALLECVRRDIVLDQQHMATCSLQWYSALAVQQFYRRERSRIALKKLLKARLLSQWWRFRRYLRLRYRTAQYLSQWAKSCLDYKKFIFEMHRHACARKIQSRFRFRLKNRYFFNSIKILLTVKRTYEHVLLFGKCRAKRAIDLQRDPSLFAKPNPILRLLDKVRRRRLQRLLKSSRGKMSFFVLSQFCGDIDSRTQIIRNHVIEWIRLKILSPNTPKSSPEPRKSSFMFSRSSKSSRSSQFKANDALVPPVATNLSIDNLPILFKGAFRVRSIHDAFLLIRDLLAAAKAHPSHLNDAVIPTLPQPSMSSRGARKKNTPKNNDSALSLKDAKNSSLSATSKTAIPVVARNNVNKFKSFRANAGTAAQQPIRKDGLDGALAGKGLRSVKSSLQVSLASVALPNPRVHNGRGVGVIREMAIGSTDSVDLTDAENAPSYTIDTVGSLSPSNSSLEFMAALAASVSLDREETDDMAESSSDESLPPIHAPKATVAATVASKGRRGSVLHR